MRVFFFSSRRRHTRLQGDWSSDVCSSDLWPLAARAQQPVRIAKIGHIESGLPSSSPNLLAAFRQGLRELGYVEGQNRYAEGREERLPQLAEELVQFGVDVIFAIGPPQALAAAKTTNRIPIVF